MTRSIGSFSSDWSCTKMVFENFVSASLRRRKSCFHNFSSSIRTTRSQKCISSVRSNMKSSRRVRRGTPLKFLERNELTMSDMEGPESSERSAAPAKIDRKRQAFWLRRLRNIRYPLTVALLSTVITFVFGFCANLVIEDKMPPEGWLGIWERWDAIHYLN